MGSVPVYLVPLLGPFHLRNPRYNAATVVDLLEALQPDRLATSALAEGAMDDPGWQDTQEIALPLAVWPWARRRGLELALIGEPTPDPNAEADMMRYLRDAGGADRVARVEASERPLRALLEQPLDLNRIEDELIPALEDAQRTREAELGAGPGSNWRGERLRVVAARALALSGERVALLSPVEHVPLLRGHLEGQARRPQAPEPSEAARRRALLDSALGGEARDPRAVLEALSELPDPEARVAEADVLLANGHAAEALERLEAASHQDFQHPYHLPGWLLARLGQVYDLAGRRNDALRAYRGVLALSWAPEAAREAASEGMERPFDLPDG